MTLTEILKNPYVIVAGLALLVSLGFLVYMLILGRKDAKKRKLQQSETKVEDIKPTDITEKVVVGNPNVLYFDVKRRSFSKKRVVLIKDKDYGREWFYNGERLFAVANNGENGVLTPIIPPYELEQSPFNLYWAISTMGFMRALFGSRNKKSDATRIGLLIAALVVMAFLMIYAMRGQ